MNDSEVNRRIAARCAAAALIAAAIALIAFDAPAVHAQSIMRTPNLNIGSRTPNITARINPNVAGRTRQHRDDRRAGRQFRDDHGKHRRPRQYRQYQYREYGRRQDDHQHRSTTDAPSAGRPPTSAPPPWQDDHQYRTTAVRTTTSVTARVTPNVTSIVTPRVTPTITPTVTPVITPRVAVVVPTLPYVRYSPNLYPACTYAYRDSSGECSGQPISSVDLGGSGGFNGPPARSQNAGGPRRNAAQAAVNLRYISDQIIAEVDNTQADDLARRHRLIRIASQEFR